MECFLLFLPDYIYPVSLEDRVVSVDGVGMMQAMD